MEVYTQQYVGDGKYIHGIKTPIGPVDCSVIIDERNLTLTYDFQPVSLEGDDHHVREAKQICLLLSGRMSDILNNNDEIQRLVGKGWTIERESKFLKAPRCFSTLVDEEECSVNDTNTLLETEEPFSLPKMEPICGAVISYSEEAGGKSDPEDFKRLVLLVGQNLEALERQVTQSAEIIEAAEAIQGNTGNEEDTQLWEGAPTLAMTTVPNSRRERAVRTVSVIPSKETGETRVKIELEPDYLRKIKQAFAEGERPARGQAAGI